MDKVYVIYKNSKMFKDRGRKTTYLDIKSARQVISCEAKKDAERSVGYYKWIDMSKEESKNLIEQQKLNYEIKVFTDSGESL